MTTLAIEAEPLAMRVETDDAHLTVHLADGRALVVPLDWYPRLVFGTRQERAQYELWEEGAVLAWPDLDEHIGVSALVAGRRSRESQASLARWKKKMEARRRSPESGPWVKREALPEWWDEA